MALKALQLWGRPSSSNTQKVSWLLAELDLPHRLVLASGRLGHGSEYLCDSTGGAPFGAIPLVSSPPSPSLARHCTLAPWVTTAHE